MHARVRSDSRSDYKNLDNALSIALGPTLRRGQRQYALLTESK